MNSATPKDELIKSINMRNIKIRNENIYGKPNSKIKNMREILKIEVDPNNILYVGDGLLDKDCAEKFSIDFACIVNKNNISWSTKQKFNFKDNYDLINLFFSNF